MSTDLKILLFVGAIIIGYIIWVNREKIIGSIKFGGSSTPILDMYSRDLTMEAKTHQLDPVIGRKMEIERATQILSRRTKNNPILLGEPGVGKTAIVEGLAQRIVEGNVPESLRDKRVLALNISALIAGTKYRGEFEARLKKIMEEIRNAQRQIILFIDEIHTILEAKGAEGALDPSDILKPPLARGDLQAIGATTINDFEKYIKPDESLERRFQPITVSPPTIKMTIEILKGIAPVYENHHRVKFTNDALKAAAVFSDKYIKDRFLPDKAIDLMDEAAAKIRLAVVSIPDKIKGLENGLKKMEEAKAAAADPKMLENLNKRILKTKEKINHLTVLYEKDQKELARPEVEVEDIKDIVSEWSGIPRSQIVEAGTIS
ncbi:MAG: AAA family ATPase [Patescibacteria group bacterium]